MSCECNFKYEYVRFLNRPTNNYVVEAMVYAFIKKDTESRYAFVVNYVSWPALTVQGAVIKVYKPNFETQKLDYIGEVNAGTNLSPADLDSGLEVETPVCEFQQYWE